MRRRERFRSAVGEARRWGGRFPAPLPRREPARPPSVPASTRAGWLRGSGAVLAAARLRGAARPVACALSRQALQWGRLVHIVTIVSACPCRDRSLIPPCVRQRQCVFLYQQQVEFDFH
ncbi:hypothetical protein Q9966_005599 [Columba livia]|nr:hypothetical protein Q9966_005599 [Columba livia]